MKHVYVENLQTVFSFAQHSVVKTAMPNGCSVKGGIVRVARAPIFYAGIAVSNLCDLTCRHCPVSTTTNPSRAVGFSREMLTRLIEGLCRQGLARVSITGGEPFLYPLLRDAVRLLAVEGVDSKLNTNGIHANLDMLDALAAHGLSEIDVSINDANDDSDCYRRAGNLAPVRLAGLTRIAHAFKGRIVITASSVMTHRIVDRFEETALALADAGADQWRLRELMPAAHGHTVDPSIFPSILWLLKRLRDLREAQLPMDIFGYLFDIISGSKPGPRCKNLEEHYIFAQNDGTCWWMHGLGDTFLGRFDGGNMDELAGILAKTRDRLPIPSRCKNCPARFVCVVSPLAAPAIAKLSG